MFGPESGWSGNFTREQAPGAYPNGTRIEKTASKPGDGSPDGAKGTVLGSMSHPMVGNGYFVEWDAYPRHAVFVAGPRVKLTA